MKLSEERVLEIFSSLNFTQNETNVMLHIFKNYLQKERKIVLNNIASELNFTGEYIRRVLDSAIKKMISNPISEYFWLPVSEVRLIILKYLENIKYKIKINALYEHMSLV